MSFLNIGKKDEYGRQRRIEHRGNYLRASRTGGVALRAQAKAAGMTMTANTHRGFRVSTTPLKRTQVALQNGRFILRGRYGSGPTKLNLSKSGVSVSTRNALGTYNWIKPNRSSAKIAGVQFRGKKAADMQLIYMLVMLAVALLQVVFQVLQVVLQVLFKVTVAVLDFCYRVAMATPYWFHALKRRTRNWQLKRRFPQLEATLDPPATSWNREQLLAGLLLILTGWGRGREPGATAKAMASRSETIPSTAPMFADCVAQAPEMADTLEKARDQATDEKDSDPRAMVALIAERLAKQLPREEIPEAIMQADDLALADGPRTRLQEQMLEVFADFAGIRFQETETPAETPKTAPAREQGHTVIDLNTASQEELETIPHIGPERARQLIALRPISDLSELKAIDGIGPGRLEDIRAYGVRCS